MLSRRSVRAAFLAVLLYAALVPVPALAVGGTCGSGPCGAYIDSSHIGGFVVDSSENLLFKTGTGAPEIMRITPDGKLGVGTTTPRSSVDFSAKTDGLLLQTASAAASASCTGYTGAIRYNSNLSNVEFCDGSNWTAWGSSGTSLLGTTATATSPQRSGDAASGFYTPGANMVAVAAGGVETMQWNTAASAVNYLSITPAATTASPIIAVAGSDSNIPLSLTPKGTGKVNITTGSLQLAGNNGLWQDTTNYNTAVGSTAFPTTVSQAGGGNNGQSNTALGYQALNANTTGQLNTAVGYGALTANTTGSINNAFGSFALNANTTGSQNSAFGYSTLYFNTTGRFNSAFGSLALNGNTTGTNNSAFGFFALGDQEGAGFTGSNNTALGTGSSNLILGTNVASTTLYSGSNNILIGTNSQVDTPSSSTSNYLNIGNTLVADTSKGILILKGSAVGTQPPAGLALL